METKLKRYRLNRRFTQAEVAYRAGMSARAYNVHETGKGGRCQGKKQDAIALVLGREGTMSISEQHDKITEATMARIKATIQEPPPVDDYYDIRARLDRREAFAVFAVELCLAFAVIGAIVWGMTR